MEFKVEQGGRVIYSRPERFTFVFIYIYTQIIRKIRKHVSIDFIKNINYTIYYYFIEKMKNSE